MWRGSCALLLSTCLLKASPASSFGGSLFAKPPPASTTSASTTSDAAPRSRAGTTPEGSARPSLTNVAAPGWSSFGHVHHRHGWALPAKYDTLEEAIAFARAQGGGDASEGEQEGGDSKGGDGGKEAEKEKQQPKKPAETAKTTPAKAPPSKGPVKAAPAKTAAAKPAAKKSGGSMGGWNWGFKSTAAKAKPAEKASGSDAKTADGGKEGAEAAAEKEKTAAAAAATAAAEAAKNEAEAAEEEKKAAAVAAAAKAAEETKAAEEKKASEAKAEEEAKAAEAMTDAERTAKESEEKASAKAAATAAAANAATAAKAEKLKAKEEEAAQRKASARSAADAAAAAKAEKVKARNEEVAQKKKAAADAVAAKKAEKTRAKEEEAAQKKAAADAVAAEKAAQIKAKEDEVAEKKAAAQAVADAAAQAAADEVKARDEEAAQKRAASAEAAAATAEKERRAEAIAALARGDEPKVEKVVKPAEATPAAEDQDKEKSDKKDKAKSDAAPATAAAAAPAKAPAPTPAKATAPATADAPAKSADTDGVKDVATDGGSADAPAEGEGEAAEKTPEKKAASKGGWGSFFGGKPKEPSSSLTLSKPETIVVVTGATGRVGQLAVRRILELYPKVLVRAVVNDFAKGSRLLQEEKDTYGIKLEIMSADLSSMRSAARVVEGASAVVFCASGYAQNLSPLQRLANAVRLTINPKSVTDVEGVRDVALALKAAKKIVNKASTTSDDKDMGKGKEEDESEPQPLFPDSPRFVLLSSAAVTRPNWSNEDKALYPLAADVPIVKLNPLNILTVKAEGEKELREVGIPYTVVRPCGLNDDHPRGRPLFSVGDTAAGRICREDVADVLVRCLGTAEATGKTFEVQTLPGLDKVAPSVKAKAGIDQALSNLPTDKDLQDNPNMLNEIRRSTYPVLTQLRPVPLAQANRQQ